MSTYKGLAEASLYKVFVYYDYMTKSSKSSTQMPFLTQSLP